MLCGLYLLRHAGARVEFVYKLIQILGLFVYAGPVITVIPLRVELLNGLALRFNMPAFMLKLVSSVIVVAAISIPYIKQQLPLIKRRLESRRREGKANA